MIDHNNMKEIIKTIENEIAKAIDEIVVLPEEDGYAEGLKFALKQLQQYNPDSTVTHVLFSFEWDGVPSNDIMSVRFAAERLKWLKSQQSIGRNIRIYFITDQFRFDLHPSPAEKILHDVFEQRLDQMAQTDKTKRKE